MSIHILRAAALAAALLSANWATAAPLSLEQALDLAAQRSQMARAARAGATGAAEMARASGQQPDPMLAVGIDNLPATGSNRFRTSAEEMTMKRIGIAQEWVPADKRTAREAVANAVAGRELVAEHVAVAEARLQTALAYIDAYYAGMALELTTLNEKHAREELEAGKGRLATVSGSSAEVLGLAGAVGVAEDESADQRQQQGAAAAVLQRWTGMPVDGLSEPRTATVPALDAYVAAHPVVVTKLRDIEVARQEASAATLNRKPNWTWEVSYGQRQGMSDLVSFGVRIPLPVAPAARQDRETAARLALVDKAEAELEEARRAAAGEYAALVSDARRLQERMERFDAGVLTPLRQRTAATLAAYRSNQASLVMLFEARHAEVEAQRKLLALRRDLTKTQAQLAFKPIAQGAVR
ncbi:MULTISPECIES: TolC family protein [unclassified Methylibium]|uniref:TolC family protein n=1 Tax=unclassified Methylibium TaxID=2633235 RepID=UPI0003F40C47|nr:MULTISPECIES: TolC family protein [unclassified Methylibium]EWS55978.1 Outer membrane efflux protein [Methylibium sp. T29]EWS62073.1 Outer membrane efflux protein [Methylibium sp. T29-B]MBL8360037.1 TolC family protein [Rubrivivax sp.]